MYCKEKEHSKNCIFFLHKDMIHLVKEVSREMRAMMMAL